MFPCEGGKGCTVQIDVGRCGLVVLHAVLAGIGLAKPDQCAATIIAVALDERSCAPLCAAQTPLNLPACARDSEGVLGH